MGALSLSGFRSLVRSGSDGALACCGPERASGFAGFTLAPLGTRFPKGCVWSPVAARAPKISRHLGACSDGATGGQGGFARTPKGAPDALWQPREICCAAKVPRLQGIQPVGEARQRSVAMSRRRWLVEVIGSASRLHRTMTQVAPEEANHVLVDACYAEKRCHLSQEGLRDCAIRRIGGWGQGLPIH